MLLCFAAALTALGGCGAAGDKGEYAYVAAPEAILRDRVATVYGKTGVVRNGERVQVLENEGYQFEAAEASFELLLRKEIGRYRSFWELDHYRVVILKSDRREPVSVAQRHSLNFVPF